MLYNEEDGVGLVSALAPIYIDIEVHLNASLDIRYILIHMENEYSMHNMTIPLSSVYYVLCIAYTPEATSIRVKVLWKGELVVRARSILVT